MRKRLTIALAAITMMVSCTQAQDTTQQKETAQEAAKTAKVVEINTDQFGELVADVKADKWQLKSNIPVVVDFNATWCGPCKRLAPILEELAQEYDGRIAFYSVDVDKNRPLAQAFQARSIPMLLLCPVDGEPQQIVGLYPKEELVKAFDYMFFKPKE